MIQDDKSTWMTQTDLVVLGTGTLSHAVNRVASGERVTGRDHALPWESVGRDRPARPNASLSTLGNWSL